MEGSVESIFLFDTLFEGGGEPVFVSARVDYLGYRWKSSIISCLKGLGEYIKTSNCIVSLENLRPITCSQSIREGCPIGIAE
jgi:hypothetical protein